MADVENDEETLLLSKNLERNMRGSSVAQWSALLMAMNIFTCVCSVGQGIKLLFHETTNN